MTVFAKFAAAIASALGGKKPAFADARRKGVRMNGIAARSGRARNR
ncbi:MAG: hypothetical protein JWR84_1953 [Caulobacter sp.]|nr:hypothetical protein [Caulobacter sp.]